MEIDVTSPEGNTLAALGIATRMMRKAGASSQVITALRMSVMGAPNPHAARRAITRATNGAITFVDPREED